MHDRLCVQMIPEPRQVHHFEYFLVRVSVFPESPTCPEIMRGFIYINLLLSGHEAQVLSTRKLVREP